MKQDTISPSARGKSNGGDTARSDAGALSRRGKVRPARRARRGDPGDAREIGGTMAKALGILEHIAENRGRPAAIADISSVLGVSKPTGHRIAAALEEMGYLKRDPVARRLIEGDRLVRLAFNVLTTAAGRPPLRRILQALVETIDETCNVGVVTGNQVAYIDRVESRWPLGLRFEIGSRVPMHCTAIGKLMLSTMSSKQRERFLSSAPLERYTQDTITDPAALRRELAQIRKRRISTDDQEFMSGVVCVAVPIMGCNGRVCAGVALSAPHARLTLEQALAHLPPLQEAARKLSEAFCGEEPPSD
jgi:DNA-binding IclR family transcriptional regulator